MAYGLYTAGVSVRSGMTEFASFLAVVDFETVVEGLFGAIFGTLLILLIGVMLFAAGYGLYFLFSLPRRRLDRAMIFLNIVDSGIRRNVTPEETIKSAAACCDNSVSVRFHLLAAWIERGATWREAVGLVPRLLPPSVTEMLLMADRVGGWSKIFPVCQRQLADVSSQLRARQSALSPSLLILPLPIMFISAMLMRRIVPKFNAIAADYGQEVLPFWRALAEGSVSLSFLFWAAFLLPVLVFVGHVGGPRLWAPFNLSPWPIGDMLDWYIPWQKQRLQRDFAALLGLLLDAGVPEGEAVELAAKGTANKVLKRKASQVRAALTQGQPLVEAMRLIDARGELHWRFEQAAAGGTRFETALAGWCDALQAKADQMEQTATHVISVLLLLFNAFLVGAIVIYIFRVLILITEKGLE